MYRRDIKEILTEELGIAKKVVEISTQIEKHVYNLLNSTEEETLIQIQDDLKLIIKKRNYIL